MKTGFTLLAAALLLMPAGHAATYHVDVLTGSDSRDGATAATAWKTLAQACGQVAAGDSVIVHPGVYHESAVLQKAGTAEQPIRFSADQVARGRVIITGANRDLRERRNAWASEPEHPEIYSTSLAHRPARVLADDIDLFPYPTLAELDTLELSKTFPGPPQGFAYDEKARKLYVRLNRKYGGLSPATHVMKAAPAGGGSGATRRMDAPFDANFAVRGAGPAHVILDGFTFETPGLCGVFVESGEVTVRNCWFIGCRTGVAGRVAAAGKSTDDVTIERCDFTQEPVFADVEDIVARVNARRAAGTPVPKLGTNFWSVRGGTTTYEYGLALHVGARWKILRNYIHDGVDGLSHWSLGAARDVEIAFNTFERLVDNGIETGDHCGTLRAHDNYLADVFEPFSWDPKGGTPWPGPLTFDHNVVTSTVRGGKLWLGLGVRPGCIELNCADTNWSKPEMQNVPKTPVKIPGGLTVHNNTIILPLSDFFTFTGLPFRRIDGVRVLNNLIVTRELTPARYHEAADLSGMEFDGNLVAPASDDAPRADRRLAGPKGRVVERASEFGLTAPSRRNFKLEAKSPALEAGVAAADLPGLSRDIGAVARGASGVHEAAGPELTPAATSAKPR